MSLPMNRLVPILLLTSASPSHALDARNPDPVSVLEAAFAAQNVGNVEAATAFYTEDAVITNTRGREATGKEGLRRFHESNRDANVQFSVGTDPVVDGSKVTLHGEAKIEFFDKIGLDLVEVGTMVIVEGNRIKALRPFYPLRAVARIDAACRERGADVPFFGRPCSEFVDGARAYTTQLISQGLVPNE